MKRSELKNIIKECVKEVLFEEGILSNLVAEVAAGITKAQQQIINEAKPVAPRNKVTADSKESDRRRQQKIQETKRKMIDAIGAKSMKGVFEGTEPLPSAPSSPHSPLANRDSKDPGVDISDLFNLAGSKWSQLK